MFRRLNAILIGCCLLVSLSGSLRASSDASSDTSKALWWLYQLQYDKAHQVIDHYIQLHPNDPAGYFYKTGIDWWHLAQDFDHRFPDVEERMDQSYQQTVRTARAMLDDAKDDKTKALASFYWGGAEGLKGRWLVTQKRWIGAYRLGKRGHRLLQKSLEYDPTLYDAYLGLGIYDYYTDTLPGIQKVLASLLIRGDKKRGLRELQIAIDKGTHARVEAMIFLVEIYTTEERMPEKALPITEDLVKEFPQSPAMQLARVMTRYTMKDWEPMMKDAADFLKKSKEETPYFVKPGVLPARYCLGIGEFFGRHNIDAAEKEMDEILSIQGDQDTSRWVTYALLRKAQIYDLRGDRPKAMVFYRKVISRSDLWGSQDEAQKYLRTPFTF